MKIFISCLLFIILFGFSSCQKNLCPAYNGLTHDNQFNPNTENKEYASNKAKVEAKKKEQLSPKRSKRGKSSLFPKNYRVKSR